MMTYRPALDLRQRLKYRVSRTALAKHAQNRRAQGSTMSGWLNYAGYFFTRGHPEQIGAYQLERDINLTINDQAITKLNIDACLSILNLPKQKNINGDYTYRNYTFQQIVYCYNASIPQKIVTILNEGCLNQTTIPNFLAIEDPRLYVWVSSDGRETVNFKLYIDKFPIQVETENGIVNGFIPGPVELNFSPFERMHGFSTTLQSIDTDNVDIANILKGKKISQKRLLKYCEPVRNIPISGELSASMLELSQALDVITCNHPLSEKARDILVHVEKLSTKVSDTTLVTMLKATTTLITEDSDLAARVSNYEAALNKMKKTATTNILRGIGYSLLTLAMCLLVVTIPFLFIPFDLSESTQKKITANPDAAKYGLASFGFTIFSSAMKSKALNKNASKLLIAASRYTA